MRLTSHMQFIFLRTSMNPENILSSFSCTEPGQTTALDYDGHLDRVTYKDWTLLSPTMYLLKLTLNRPGISRYLKMSTLSLLPRMPAELLVTRGYRAGCLRYAGRY